MICHRRFLALFSISKSAIITTGYVSKLSPFAIMGTPFSSASSSTSAPGEIKSKNHLKTLITDKIRVGGPITFAEYMRIAATGYYSLKASSGTETIFGAAGDFITSPELSQIFGELLGVWCVHELFSSFSHQGPWQLVELGPGNGSLSNDILSTLKQFRLIVNENREKNSPLSVHFVEISDALAARQEALLCHEKTADIKENSDGGPAYFKTNMTKFGVPIFWYKNLDDVPARFSIFLAHEFFDALPVHKFQRSRDGKWREIFVDMDAEKAGNFKFVLARGESLTQRAYLKEEFLKNLPDNVDHVEISPQSLHIVRQLAKCVRKKGGAALIVDYGENGVGKGDTVRAFRGHKVIADPFSYEPGECDLTADVNFQLLKNQAANDAYFAGPITQAEFLRNLGVDVRFEQLMKTADSDEKRSYLRDSYNMLMDNERMGTRFKVLAMFPKSMTSFYDMQLPAGFAKLK